MKSAPSFLTHHELDRLLGGPRTRQRWQARGWLPEPYELGRVNRTELKLFPSFVLVLLAVGSRQIDLPAFGALRREARRTFESDSFHELIEPLRETVGAAPGAWRFAAILAELAEIAPGPLQAWGETVGHAEHELDEHWGIAISRRLGEVADTGSGLYVVRFDDAPEEQLPLRRVLAPLESGESAYVEQTQALGTATSFLLPHIPGLDPTYGAEDDEAEGELVDWFREAIGGRASGRASLAAEEEPDSPQSLPYRRVSGPRRRRFGAASTMTRLHREG